MSLQVWLPLTKDLRQQGLSNVTVTNNGATFNSAGKLGGCYSFGTGNSYITVESTPLKTFTEFSFACWVKIISWNTSYSTIFAAKNSTGVSWNNLIFSLLRISTNSTLCFNISNGSNYTSTSCQTGALSLDTWYHITCTYKNGQIKLYQDGDVVSTYNTSVVPNFNSIVNLWIGKSNENSYQSNNLLNDIRIYNHCLSPMEVKRISQGLVLHYPLNREGWGQENLVNNSDFSNLATTGMVIRDETILFHGKPTCKINRTGATANTYTGWSSQDLVSRLTPGAKVTVSVWMYRESSHGIDAGCEWRMYQRYNNNASTDWTGFYSSANWPIGEWKKFIYTYTVRSDVSSAYLSFNVVKNGTYWFAEPKIEVGEIATNWCPSSSDELATTMGLNEAIEYDCSGYCYNGTKNGTFTYTSDTPKYQVSTTFPNNCNTRIFNTEFPQITKNLTFACWCKLQTGSNSTYSFIVSQGRDSTASGFNLILYSSKFAVHGPFGTLNSNITTNNTWTHLVGTYDGATVKIYINGELKNSLSYTSDLTYTYGPAFVIGKMAYSYTNNSAYFPTNGSISDVRAYATALSADDVKALYEDSAYIASDGTGYAYDFVES